MPSLATYTRMTSKLPTQILRGSLRSSPGPSGLAGFTLPCRKLVLEYNDQWPSSKGAMDFARRGRLTQIAQQWPNVEVVLQEKPNRHPMLRAFYVNGKEKGISLRNMGIKEVSEKIKLVLDQSGKKLSHLKNRPVVAGSEESARGIWSALHVQRRND